MKALIATILVFFSLNAFAMDVNPDQMSDTQKAQLIKVLNQLEPEMLDTLLTEEALEWYISQFNRGQDMDAEVQEASVTTGKVEGIGNDFDDPNAPKFL